MTPVDDQPTIAIIEEVQQQSDAPPTTRVYDRHKGKLHGVIDRIAVLNQWAVNTCHYRLRPFGTPTNESVPQAFLEEEPQHEGQHPPLLLPSLEETVGIDDVETLEAYHARVARDRAHGIGADDFELRPEQQRIVGHDSFGNTIWLLPELANEPSGAEEEGEDVFGYEDLPHVFGAPMRTQDEEQEGNDSYADLDEHPF